MREIISPLDGIRSPFGPRRGGVVPPFTPASLFASGAPGFLLDATLSDLSSLFQDSAGTTPVTAVEQPVGLVLNTSAGLPVNPILQKYGSLPGTATNYFSTPDSAANSITGDIDIRALIAPTDWTPSAVTMLVAKWNATTSNRSYLFYITPTTGVLTVSVSPDGTSVNATSFASTVAPTVSDGGLLWVRVTVDVNNGAGGKTAVFYTSSDGLSWTQLGDSVTVAGTTSIFNSDAFVSIGSTNGGTDWFAGRIYRAQIYNGINGTLAVDFCPPAGWASGTWNSTLTSETWTANGTATVVSVANNFVQSTSAARPVLSARVNLLEKTEDLSDAYWSFFGLASRVTSSGFTTCTEDTSSLTHRPLKASVTTAALGTSVTFVASFKAGTRRYLQPQFDNGTVGVGVVLDTQNWTITPLTGSGTITASSITNLGSGEYQVSVTGFLSSGSTAVNFNVYGLSSSTQNSVNYTGNGSTIIVGKVDLRVANDTASPVYQRVNTATDYATTGFPIYLRYDGTDDFLVSAATVNFSTTAQMSVFAGVRKLSDAANSMLFEQSADYGANRGTAGIYLPSSPKVYNALLYGGTTVGLGTGTNSSAYAAPVTNLVSLLLDIGAAAANEINIRVNGLVDNATINTSAQTGNFGNYLNYIGRRGGTTLPFNGRIYFPLVVLGRTATATEIANMESYLSASMGGGYVPTGYDFLVTGDGDQLTDASDNPLYTQPLYL